MAAKFFAFGLQQVLFWLNYGMTFTVDNIAMGLFTADLDPAWDSDQADYFGSEATFDGYEIMYLSEQGEYGAPYQSGSHAKADAPTFTFECTGTSIVENIYGYFMYQVEGAFEKTIWFAERDPSAPVSIGSTAGQMYRVTPNLSSVNEA